MLFKYNIKMTDPVKFLCPLLLLAVSCSDKSIAVHDAVSDSVCVLKENLALVKSPASFAMTGDAGFVLSDYENVYLYGMDGSQKLQIGHPGRAKYEYNVPTVVRCFGDSVYVWSSFSLKFISYAIDGTPGAEYPYGSAIADFAPSDGKLFIYTAGRRLDHVVDVYDKASGKVTDSLSRSTSEHQFLLIEGAKAPMYFDGKELLFMPKDRIMLMHYDPVTNSGGTLSALVSNTFKVEKGLSGDLLDKDEEKALAKLDESSLTMCLWPGRTGYYVLTREGKAQIVNGERDNGDVYYGLYEIGPDGSHIDSYRYDSIGTLRLFSSWGSDLYYISHSIEEEEDVYVLKRLALQAGKQD